MNRSAVAPQGVSSRGGALASNGYSTQSQQQTNPPPSSQQQRQPAGTLGSSGRLQNGKLGSGSGSGSAQNWNYGASTASTPGVGGVGAGAGGQSGSQQSRNGGLSGFAQAIGASQSQASLDLSAFPSLPGAPQGRHAQQPQQQQQPPQQPQQQQQQQQQQPPLQRPSSGHSSLSNWPPSNSRTPHEQMHRVQSSTNQSANSNPPASQLHPSRQRPSESSTSHSSAFGGPAADDYRYAQQQPSRGSDMQGGNGNGGGNGGGGEEFPPLGGLGGSEMGSTRRDLSGSVSGVRTNGASNGGSSNNFPYGPPPLSQHDRSGQSSERMYQGMEGSRAASSLARSPLEHSEADAFARQDQNNGGRMSRSSVQSNFSHGQMTYRTGNANALGDAPRQSQRNASQNSGSADRAAPSQMSEQDRWGLAGLAERLSGGVSADQAALALGMDLNTLGLDLNRPDNAPLHMTWAGPFADPLGPPLRTDFHLPQAYRVTNVPPLETRISQFTDETLFMIFYDQARDNAQLWAADELYKRDWRWHKVRQQWMMKDKDSGEPQTFPDRTQERGVYNFWDVNQWDMTKSEYLLRYEDLYHPSEIPVLSSMRGEPLHQR